MRDIKPILEDYRQGDFEKRLNLYLFYREFRREFSDIEEHSCQKTMPRLGGVWDFLRRKDA